jgi:hypothetical protein
MLRRKVELYGIETERAWRKIDRSQLDSELE